jgi:flagellin
MGLRINQNIAAMNAYRNLSVSDGAMSKSLEKLSSGFRINRAADDAAGLSISEGLRSQIGGLKVAVRNAQDGVSVVQTAEGALTESHSILQRMRDLAVQSSNGGSQDSSAQGAADTEFQQLKNELDRISSTTKFGANVLLDGTYSSANTGSSTNTGAAALDNLGQYRVSVGGGGTFDFTIPANSGGSGVAVSVAYGDMDHFDGDQIAAHLEAAIKTALTGAGGGDATFANKVHVTSTTVGGTAAIQVKLDGLANGDSFTIGNDSNDLVADIFTVGGAATTSTTAVAGTGTGLMFQVGANNSAAEQISVTIGDMSSTGLQLTNTKVDTTAHANTAIDDLTTAIQTVSDQRANLGAYQNRFEHTINNLNVAVENLSASESRIRDTDMAQEMVQFTRNQILSQAGTAMLAQANQAPQSVMQLLRG